MRTLIAICLLFSSVAFAEDIPARDPYFGESRPDWWWDIWHGRVVVLEGKITFEAAEKPDIHIEFNEEQIERIIPDMKTRELQSKLLDFYVGELEISKFHYADGGAMNADGYLGRMRAGDLNRAEVLIPIMRFGDHASYGMNLQPESDNVGIHVFDYSKLILGLNLVHSSQIPTEKLSEAKKVFQLREKLVHCGVNRISHPDRGYAGFQFRVKGDAIIVENVIAGTPADKAGLKDGDAIVSINGENFKDPDLDAEVTFYSKVYDWRVGDQLEIEIRRKNSEHRVSLVLISGSDLLAKNKAEPSGADKPATAPALKLGGKEKPNPETEARPQ